MKRILSTALIPCFLLSGCASTENERAPEMNYFEKKIYEEDKRTNEVLSKASLLSAKALAVYVKTNQALKQGELTAEQIRQARAQNERVEINFEQIMETGNSLYKRLCWCTGAAYTKNCYSSRIQACLRKRKAPNSSNYT